MSKTDKFFLGLFLASVTMALVGVFGLQVFGPQVFVWIGIAAAPLGFWRVLSVFLDN